jgi:hypothetical protein
MPLPASAGEDFDFSRAGVRRRGKVQNQAVSPKSPEFAMIAQKIGAGIQRTL